MTSHAEKGDPYPKLNKAMTLLSRASALTRIIPSYEIGDKEQEEEDRHCALDTIEQLVEAAFCLCDEHRTDLKKSGDRGELEEGQVRK